jgi:V/A-type H+-transporting ATPase subunit I
MIVPMNKISLVVLDSDRERSLDKLRDVGVLHLQTSEVQSEQLADLEEKRASLERTLLLLQQVKSAPDSDARTKRSTGVAETAAEKSLEIAEKAYQLSDRQRNLADELNRLHRNREALLDWGDFDPAEVRALEEKQIYLRLFTLTDEEFGSLPEEVSVSVIKKTKTSLLVAVISTGEPHPILGTEMPLPSSSLGETERLIHETEGELDKIQEQWNALAAHRALVQRGMAELEQQLDFERARAGMGVEGPLAYITGFAPSDLVETLQRRSRQEGWAVLVEDPDEEDPVPTLVRNPKWINIIKPVFDFLGTVPGYREYDISFWFLLFLSIFFAMIIGDAGYGLLFLGASVFARFKLKKAPAEPFFLLYVFSACTVVWGAITGTWFGVSALASESSPLTLFVIDSIASFPKANIDSAEVVKYVCFVLGAVHLSIAHIKNFFRYLPHMRAAAQAGWLSIVWGMFFGIQIIVLGKDGAAPVFGWIPDLSLMDAAIFLVVGGLTLVALFAEQRNNFFKGVARGLAWLPLKLLNSISAFSDIVSYVRLFAVGLATVKVAESFNQMAAGVGFAVPAGFAAALILFFGHTLNIVMGSLSIIVHGIRLNMLEFSGHLGMEWTGIPYQPFRNRVETIQKES